MGRIPYLFAFSSSVYNVLYISGLPGLAKYSEASEERAARHAGRTRTQYVLGKWNYGLRGQRGLGG
jgi:hypothetical protein